MSRSTVFLVVTSLVFAMSLDGQVLSPCHKTPPVCSYQAGFAATSLEGLSLVGKSLLSLVSNLQDAKEKKM